MIFAIRRLGTTFGRYNLFLELSALLLVTTILFLAVWLAMGQMSRNDLALRLAEADKVDLFIKSQLDDARQDLERFIALPESDRSPQVMRLLRAFSDLYRLDDGLRVVRIDKATSESRVFIGFSVAGGRLGDYLRAPGAPGAFSEILRGYEDDAPSVYLALRAADGLYLGRLNLGYIENLLSEFSRIAGTPLMVVASDGFVMLAGRDTPKLSSFDLKYWDRPPSAGRRLDAGGRRWIPLVSRRTDMGARIVTLIPTELLDAQRKTLILFTFGFLGALLLLVYLKNRRINQLILQPVAAFAEQMRELEQGHQQPAAITVDGRFAELDSIQRRFQAMADAIQQRERSLRESEERFRLAFANANTGMCLVDLEGRLLQVNDKMSDIFGYSRSDLEAMGVDDLAVPEDRGLSLAYIEQALRGEGDTGTFEKRYRHREGQIIDCQVASSLVRDAQGQPRYFISQIQDISARKQAEAALILARDQAEAANRAKSVFLANMSHEIRTPLNAILGFAQVLVRAPELSPEHRQGVETIQRGGQHLLTLLNDVLDMAKIEAGRATSAPAAFDLAALVHETAAMFQPRARERGLALRVATSLPPGRVTGDALKLRQVLMNLVSNAIKFTDAGEVMLSAEGRCGGVVHFGVADTGIGIAPDDLELIFHPFVQVSSARAHQGSTGLGLALSRQFVKLMGGELLVESAPGQGSRFSFTLILPAAAPPEPEARAPAGRGLGLAPDQPHRRILVVDDLADNRAPLCALLRALNPQPPVLEVREAATGQEALAVWDAWQPQVIFMDMRMPSMSGEEATRAIKARMGERPDAVRSIVVALTASALDERQEHFLAIGCDAFARKPFEADELLEILERHAGLRRQREAGPPLALPVPSLSPAEAAGRLTALPADWRAGLEQAVALADFEWINTLLAGLADGDPALKHTLTGWAYAFDLERFQAMFPDAGQRGAQDGLGTHGRAG